MMSLFDPAIRFSAILILVLIAFMAQRDLLPSRSRVFLQLACVSVIGSLLDFTPDYIATQSWITRLAGLVSAFDLPLIWLFIMTLFSRAVRVGPIAALIGISYSLPKLTSHIGRSFDLSLPIWHAALIANIFGLIILIHIVTRLLLDRRDDMLNRRRRSRLQFAVALVLFSAGSTLANYLVPLDALPTARGALVWMGTLYAFVHLIHIPEDALLFSATRAASPPPEDRLPDALRRRMVVLEAEMTQRKPYLEARLSIGDLANRLGISETQLRETIGDGLGHDNFSSFINSYRIADIKRALRDPDQAHLPILTIALDHGFSSLSPFNRAFKTHVGVTPSTFRKKPSAG